MMDHMLCGVDGMIAPKVSITDIMTLMIWRPVIKSWMSIFLGNKRHTQERLCIVEKVNVWDSRGTMSHRKESL